jgi:PPOX class probable F420-dependent enzyme
VSALDAAEARWRFAAARVAVLATVGEDTAPHVVPIVFAVSGDTIYSAVDAKPKRSRDLKRLRNIHANPRVALLVDHYAEDWISLWWVRADGRGRVLDEHDFEADEALERLAERYPQQSETEQVLAVDVERWTGWAA